MRVVRSRRLVVLLAVVAALLGAAFIARPYGHGLSFVVGAAEMQGGPATRPTSTRPPSPSARS